MHVCSVKVLLCIVLSIMLRSVAPHLVLLSSAQKNLHLW